MAELGQKKNVLDDAIGTFAHSLQQTIRISELGTSTCSSSLMGCSSLCAAAILLHVDRHGSFSATGTGLGRAWLGRRSLGYRSRELRRGCTNDGHAAECAIASPAITKRQDASNNGRATST